MTPAQERKAARLWHRWELGLVGLLLITSIVGVAWAEFKGQPRFVETHPR